MLTVEGIKKGCEFADGFEYEKDNNMLQLPNGMRYYVGCGIDLTFIFELKEYKNILYRDFLQRVIEGINRAFYDERQDRYYIENNYESLDVWDNADETICFFGQYELFNSIDQAKEQAIKYILDQME